MFKIEGDEGIAIPSQLKSALDFAKTNLHCKAEVVASYSANEIQWKGRIRNIVIVLQSTTAFYQNGLLYVKEFRASEAPRRGISAETEEPVCLFWRSNSRSGGRTVYVTPIAYEAWICILKFYPKGTRK